MQPLSIPAVKHAAPAAPAPVAPTCTTAPAAAAAVTQNHPVWTGTVCVPLAQVLGGAGALQSLWSVEDDGVAWLPGLLEAALLHRLCGLGGLRLDILLSCSCTERKRVTQTMGHTGS